MVNGTAYNRAYLASVLRTFAQIPLRGTSDTLQPIKEEDIEKIRRAVQKEFPVDPALQQFHIARKIIAKEAEYEGLSFLEYVKLLGKRV